MMHRLPFAIVIFAFTTTESYSQSREFKHYVKVSPDMFIWEQGAKPKPIEFKMGQRVMVPRLLKMPGGASPVVQLRPYFVPRDSTYAPPRSTTATLLKLENSYKANITQSRDTLYVNFWLFPATAKKETTVTKALAINPTTNWRDQAGNQDKSAVADNEFIGSAQLAAPAPSPTPADLAPKEAAPSDIPSFKRSNTYFILLHDRQFRGFWFRNYELAAVTVPFQYRPGFKAKNTEGKEVTIQPQFNAALNLGTFFGFKFGHISYSYNKYEKVEPRKWSVSVGPFASITRVELKKENTLLANDTTINRSIGVVSTGGALLMDYNNFRIGAFLGFDYSPGKSYKLWDYHNRGWFGIGIGYKILLVNKFE